MIRKRGLGDYSRIYRPWAISEIYGQKGVVTFVHNGLKKGTLAHGLLFFGASGCGKTTMARSIGMGLNCENGPTDRPCFRCTVCKGILNGGHLAYREINSADCTGVDDMRDLRGQFACAPMDGRHQIIVFDECHRLSVNAQEILLKEVEDNHAQNYFIFCSTDPRKIISTLKNRLVPIEFQPFSDDEQRRLLQDVCISERIKNGREVLGTIIKEAKGMPRNALNLLQRAVEQEKVVRAEPGDIIHIAPENPSNVLIVAPHAVPHDDDNTGLVGKRIAEMLNGHAVINEKYRKPETLGHDEPDIAKGLVNLNRWDQIEMYPEIIEEFIAPIEASKECIKKNYTKSLVVHIHGISDENLSRVAEAEKGKSIKPQKLQILVGYGQTDAVGRDFVKRLTAKGGLGPNLMKALQEEGIPAMVAPVYSVVGIDGKPKLYCGSDPNGLNQKLCKPKSRVQSIQLEIGFHRLRDNDNSVLVTAYRISRALSQFAEGIDAEKLNSVKAAVEKIEASRIDTVPLESFMDVEKKAVKDQHKSEKHPDMELVEMAFTRLAGIYSGNFEKGMMEAGRYLVDTFYGGDIERAQKNDSPLKKSLHSLLGRLNENKAPGMPSKSWVYNAVKLVVAKHDLRYFFTYGKLGLSQKILLFPVRDIELKKKLINESVENNYTVVRMRERIAEETGNNVPTAEDPLKLMKNPDNLFNTKYSFWQTDQLATLPAEKKKALITRSQDRIREISSVIAASHESLDKYEAFTMTLISADKQPAEADISGTREWAADTENNSTGCSNMCRYCWACADALRRKQIATRDEWGTCRIRVHDVLKKHRKYSGRIMFPSSHDILPENIYACLITLENLLRAGNRVLIVSKPRVEMIKILCSHLKRYKSSILFRFTIGALDNELLSFWEPHAPRYEERKKALQYAYDKKYATSVSVEPMLDANHIDELVVDLLPLVTDAIWIGKMNRIKHCVDITDDAVEKAVQRIEADQADENIKAIYARHKDNPKIKWKGGIKKLVGLKMPESPGMDQ